ncbi:hypothetical protein [Streptomyces sp. NPDC098781]|uniref:hypothetical protein n=1 Tax=Streptomyces sp. NPDC098781 TaxID=3366097 RepID=UPI003822495A
MSTNGMLQSAESATRNGIQALEMAFNGVLRCRQDVEATRMNLASGYGGADGGRFQNVVVRWEEQADIILKNLEGMVDALNETLTQHGMAQGSSNEAIDQQFAASEQVFDALVG